MLNKTTFYQVYLHDQKIGRTLLNSGDPSMGVISGIIEFEDSFSPYQTIKDHCERLSVAINDIDDELQLIDTQDIANLHIRRDDGSEITGIAAPSISGMSEEGYYVSILGIDSALYESEFSEVHAAYYRES